MDKKKTLVLFDVGGVLHGLDYNKFYEEGAKLSGHLSPEEVKKKYVDSGLEERFLRGEISIRQFLDEMKTLLDPKEEVTDEQLKKMKGLGFTPQFDELVELKKRVHKAGYSVGILSNCTELSQKIISQRHPKIYETYDESSPRVYSFKVKAIKPDKRMYEQVKGYDTVILIDDKISYLKVGIEDFGWYGIWFAPNIDSSDPMHMLHGKSKVPEKNFQSANSYEELLQVLRDFGINL